MSDDDLDLLHVGHHRRVTAASPLPELQTGFAREVVLSLRADRVPRSVRRNEGVSSSPRVTPTAPRQSRVVAGRGPDLIPRTRGTSARRWI